MIVRNKLYVLMNYIFYNKSYILITTSIFNTYDKNKIKYIILCYAKYFSRSATAYIYIQFYERS